MAADAQIQANRMTTGQESQGLPTTASASSPPTRPRGVVDSLSPDHAHENTTIEAKLRGTQESMRMEVTSIRRERGDHDRTQIPGQPDPFLRAGRPVGWGHRVT